MKFIISLLFVFFASHVLAYEEVMICQSKQDNLIQYNKIENINEDITSYYKIKIDTNVSQIYVFEVLENGIVSEQSQLYTDQVWTISSPGNEDIRAYGSLLGEIMYSKNSRLLTFTFPLGSGYVGVTLAECN